MASVLGLLGMPVFTTRVNAETYLPVLVPMAPAAGVTDRFPGAMADVLLALEIEPDYVAAEAAEMGEVVVAKTASRRVLGVMNEFAFMAEHTIGTGRSDPDDLLGLSVWLAGTIVGPLGAAGGYTPIGALRKISTSGPDDPSPT